MIEKSQIRNNYRKIRRDMGPEAREMASKKAFAHLRKHPDYKRAKSLFLFVSQEEEIETEGWIDEIVREKRLFIPYIPKGAKEMILTEIKSRDELVLGNFHIRAIRPDLISERRMDVADLTLVPGLVFDDEGYRIGYGGGYYDRYLSAHPETLAYGVGFACQRTDSLPHGPHDMPVSGYFSEEGFTSFPRRGAE